MWLESKFQHDVINVLSITFPGCIVQKLDSSYTQGIPDLLILYEGMWAALECKRDEKSKHQPNQDYYIKRMDEMSFARFIYPANMWPVIEELEQFFREGGRK